MMRAYEPNEPLPGVGVPLFLQRTTTFNQKRLDNLRSASAAESVARATPVPESFDQAVCWAVKAALDASDDGIMRQSMFFSAGDSETGITGNFGRAMPFAEQFVKRLAADRTLKGGIVRAVFTDMGAQGAALERWGYLPDNLKLCTLPAALTGRSIAHELEELQDASMLVIVAPSKTELPALTQVDEVVHGCPIILINAMLPTAIGGGAASNMFRSFMGSKQNKQMDFAAQLTPTFHLQHLDPPERFDDLNSGVIARAYPSPFSVWEDNEDDPEAIDGFFLLHLQDHEIPSLDLCFRMLQDSRVLAKKVAEKREAKRLRMQAEQSKQN